MSEGQEIALGAESDPGVIAYFGLYPDDKMQAFINEKGKQMAGISHRPNLDYKFRVLDSPVVNAFAVPGGYVYFTRGIMANFNNEAEFAGVLGHEIGHITARHSARQQTTQILLQVGLIAGMVVSKDFAQFADEASQSLGLLMLKFSRDHESQSDKLGVEYSTKIGYDAHEMADFFNTLKRMSEKSGQSIPTFLSTHPDPGDRYNKVHQYASQWQQNAQYTNLKVNTDSYLHMIDGLVYGEDPRQGYVENDVFYHPELKFRYPIPRGWKTVNTPQQVQMAQPDGKALIILTVAQGANLDEAAKNVLEQYKITLIKSQKVRVNGLPAIAMTAQQVNEQTNSTIRVLAYLIEYNGMIYNFLGVSDANDFNQYQPLFSNTMVNFRKLTDPGKLNIQPERILIKTVKRDGSLEQVLSSFGVPANRLKELAIVNGMQLNERLSQGTLIKVVGQH